MSRQVYLTIDVDWAPDFVLDDVRDLLLDSGLKATWFCTHLSPAVATLSDESTQFEVGIHPNFLPGSSHGTSIDQVMSHMHSLFPNATSMRTHGVYHSGRLAMYLAEYPKIELDSSFFLPLTHQVEPVYHQTSRGGFWKVPFRWADDYALSLTAPCWDIQELIAAKANVLLFHPVHIYYNCRTYTDYVRLQDYIKVTGEWPSKGYLEHRPGKQGVRDCFLQLASSFNRGNCFNKLQDILPIR